MAHRHLPPGIDPVGNLATALEALPLPRKIEALPYLRRSARGIIDYADAAGIQSDQRFVGSGRPIRRTLPLSARRPVRGQDNAALFVRLLLEAAGDSTNGYVAITMRADFLGDCSLFYGLAEKINAGMYLLPKMQRRQLREMIEQPVRLARASISPVLVERLIGESEEREDGLPLLQHALMRIWNNWASRGRPDSPIDEHDFDLPSKPGVSRPLIELRSRPAPGQHLRGAPARKPGSRRTHVQALSERDPRGREVRRGVPFEDLAATLKTTPEKLLTIIDAFRDESKGRTFLMPPKGRRTALRSHRHLP